MILLDTPCLIWWVNRNAELSVTALGRIEAERPSGKILISAVSALEIGILVRNGRLVLRTEPAAWLAQIGAIPETQFVPIDSTIALQSVSLPAPAPAGTAAKLLAATARQMGCPVLTPAKNLQEYPHIQAIW